MNDIYFPTIGLRLKKRHHSFSDLGFVNDMTKALVELYIDFFGTSEGVENFVNESEIWTKLGTYLTIRYGKETLWLIMYLHVNSDTDAFIRGYLESIVINNMGEYQKLRRILEEKFPQIRKLRMNQEYRDKFTPFIGGLYAMKEREMNVQCLPRTFFSNPFFIQALAIYNSE
ncbi:MAG: hypothetical protein QXM68_00975 [Candidatus Aenigmatarchaeota archaeon]|nr:hypothetical protein [Candidatus Aenigmarchaeota archaeon]